MRWFLPIFASMTLSCVTPAAAASLTAVLGDSLSDPCNLWTLDPAAVPNPPYPDRQQTNGDTWATKLGSNCASGLNFAYGGATAVESNPNPVRGRDTIPSSGTTPTPDVPDLKAQSEAFVSSPVGQSPDIGFIAIWIGANDLFNVLETTNPIDLPVALQERSAAVIATVSEVIASLAQNGPPNAEFVLFGVPPLGDTPLINVRPDPLPGLVNATTAALNDGLEEVAQLFSLAGTPVQFFDIEFFFNEIINNPADFGFVNVTESCIDDPLCGPVFDPNLYLFYDRVHPTQAGHQIILSEYRALTAIPIPAGLPLYLSAALALVPLVVKHRRSVANPTVARLGG